MDVKAVPPVTAAESSAIRRALVQAGVDLDGQPAGYTSAWRRAAAAEAVGEDEEDRLASGGEHVLLPPGYAPSPRSTRGATRA